MTFPGVQIIDRFLKEYLATGEFRHIQPRQFVKQQLQIEDYQLDKPAAFYREFWEIIHSTDIGDALEDWIAEHPTPPVAKRAPPPRLVSAEVLDTGMRNRNRGTAPAKLNLAQLRKDNSQLIDDIEESRLAMEQMHLHQAQIAAAAPLQQASPWAAVLSRIASYKSEVRKQITLDGVPAAAEAFQRTTIAKLNV